MPSHSRIARPVATHRTIKDWLASRKNDLVVIAIVAGLIVLMVFVVPYCC